MDEAEAIDRVRRHVLEHYPAYPAEVLKAVPFAAGWTVFAPSDPKGPDFRVGQAVFLIGDDGSILDSSSSVPPSRAEAEFLKRYGPAAET